MIKWISVEDQPIPRNSKPVLVYLAGESLGSQIHTGIFHPNCSFIGGRFEQDLPEITHWARISNTPNDFREHPAFKRRKLTEKRKRVRP